MISNEIDVVRRRRAQLRERRQKGAVPTVALVGYTNAGKTTLFNALTGDRAVASDALFVTLDPLVRKVRLPDRRELLVSDTVGFIDRLPHSLVAAFRATLEEVAASDLLVHVIDASNPNRELQMAAVRSVLAEVGAADVPSIEVFNKLDRLDPGERARLQAVYPGAVTMSAVTGEGRDELVAVLEALNFVYAGNLPGRVGEYENTYCPKCRAVLVERYSYTIRGYSITSKGSCPRCCTTIPGVWSEQPEKVRLNGFGMPRLVR